MYDEKIKTTISIYGVFGVHCGAGDGSGVGSRAALDRPFRSPDRPCQSRLLCTGCPDNTQSGGFPVPFVCTDCAVDGCRKSAANSRCADFATGAKDN